MSSEFVAMFYELEHPDAVLRFGDIVKGLVYASSMIDAPSSGALDYRIDVIHDGLFAIMTPCCSIGEQGVLLCPLRRINPAWFRNPYFQVDLTRINAQMTAEQAMPPEKWLQLSSEQKQQRSEAGLTYAYREYFVFAPNVRIPTYADEKIKQDIGYRMIDFRRIHRAGCKQDVRGSEVAIKTKVLQLTTEARRDLRDKLGFYFSNPPEEDLCRT